MQAARFPHTFLIVLFLTLPLPLLAQAAGDRTLTNADVVRMMKAGLPESVIVREIQMSTTNFHTDPASLIDLRHHGAPEAVLGAMLDSRSGGGQPMAGPLPAPYGSVGARAHHLPNFQADVKVKSHSLAKVSMSQNHIKVEKAGQPLFDLKWKEKHDP